MENQRMSNSIPKTGEWNYSLTSELLWSSVNVSEAVLDVMGTGVGTRRLCDGQTITVNGSAGTVRMKEKAPLFSAGKPATMIPACDFPHLEAR
jgi:hypothetical protein